MKKGAWRYFREGTEYSEITRFIEDNISLITNPLPDKGETGNECFLADKRIRIIIDIFDE